MLEDEKFGLYIKLAGALAFVFVINLIKNMFAGPTKEQLDCFRIADDGGAMKRLNKDEKDRVTLKLSRKTKITPDTYIFRFTW